MSRTLSPPLPSGGFALWPPGNILTRPGADTEKARKGPNHEVESLRSGKRHEDELDHSGADQQGDAASGHASGLPLPSSSGQGHADLPG